MLGMEEALFPEKTLLKWIEAVLIWHDILLKTLSRQVGLINVKFSSVM